MSEHDIKEDHLVGFLYKIPGLFSTALHEVHDISCGKALEVSALKEVSGWLQEILTDWRVDQSVSHLQLLHSALRYASFTTGEERKYHDLIPLVENARSLIEEVISNPQNPLTERKYYRITAFCYGLWKFADSSKKYNPHINCNVLR